MIDDQLFLCQVVFTGYVISCTRENHLGKVDQMGMKFLFFIIQNFVCCNFLDNFETIFCNMNFPKFSFPINNFFDEQQLLVDGQMKKNVKLFLFSNFMNFYESFFHEW
jgi:hypothetical protein